MSPAGNQRGPVYVRIVLFEQSGDHVCYQAVNLCAARCREIIHGQVPAQVCDIRGKIGTIIMLPEQTKSLLDSSYFGLQF